MTTTIIFCSSGFRDLHGRMMSSDSDFDSDVTIDPNEDRVISDVDSDTDTAGISRSVHVGSTVKGNLRNNTSMNSVHAISDSESSEDDIKVLNKL